MAAVHAEDVTLGAQDEKVPDDCPSRCVRCPATGGLIVEDKVKWRLHHLDTAKVVAAVGE